MGKPSFDPAEVVYCLLLCVYNVTILARRQACDRKDRGPAGLLGAVFIDRHRNGMDQDHIDAIYRETFYKPSGGGNAYGRGLDDDRVSLREILTKFWVRKRLIFGSIIICAGLAFFIAKLMTPTYTSQAMLLVNATQTSAQVVETQSTIPIQTSPEVVQSEAYVLQSRALAIETIARLHLDRDPEFDPSVGERNHLRSMLSSVTALFDQVQDRLRTLTGFLSDAPATSEDNGAVREKEQFTANSKPSTLVVNEFLRRLHVFVQQRSNVIGVSFESSRPLTAALVPNTLIQLYLERHISEKDKALAEEAEHLDNVVLPTLRRKMQASESALAEYRQKSGLMSNQNPTVLAQELSETKAQLAMARARTSEAAVRLSQAQSGSASGASAAVASESPTLQVLREQEVNLQAQLGAVKGSLGPNHPKTVQLETQLKELRDGIRREGAGFVGRLKADLAAAQATETELGKRVAEFTRQFAQVNGGDVQLQNLIGEADADRKTYEQYLARSNEVHGSVGHGQPGASLLSSADVPLRASPDIKRTVLIGAVIGAGIGLLLVAMLDGLIGGLRNREQVEEILGIRCLGSLPMIEGFRRKRLLGTDLQRALEGSSPIRPLNTAFGQAVHGVHLKLLSPTHDRSWVVLVTAALPAEGKTWVAASLAASLATHGHSVALVDCDLHRPSVHRIFNGPRGPGLTDYFAGGIGLDQVVHHDPGSGASYIPVGTALSQEAWRLTFGRMRSLIDALRERYALIILDSAPVLAASDAILLSQVAQKAILVVKWGSTPPAIARHAATQLLETGGTEVAAVLSMVNTKRAARHGDPVASVYKQLDSYYQP